MSTENKYVLMVLNSGNPDKEIRNIPKHLKSKIAMAAKMAEEEFMYSHL